MTPQKFIEVFDTVAEAPGGIERLRELVLQLAVQGKLVPQDMDDAPASDLLEQIATEKAQLVKEKVLGRQESLKPDKLTDPPFFIPKSWEWIPAIYPAYSVSDLGKKIKTKEVLETGKFPVVDQGKIKIRGYCNDKKKVINVEEPLIVFGDHTREIKLIDFDFVVGADGVKILKPICIHERYYFLALKWLPLSGRGYRRHYKLLKVEYIPLPPLAEQHRIVAKVDKFMGMIDELEATRLSREDVRTAARDSTLAKLRNASTSEDVRASWSRIADRTDDLFTDSTDLASLRETILHLAVQGRLVSQNEGDEPVNRFLDRIASCNTKNIQAGYNGKHPRIPEPDESIAVKELPNGWTWAPTADIGVLNPKNKADDDTMVSFCPMSSIPTDHRSRVTFETRRWGDIRKGYTHFADGDVVVAKITPCFQNRKSCVMSKLKGGIGAGTTELYVVRVNPIIVLPGYILLFYKSPGFLQDGVAVMTGTAGQQRVPREYLEHTPLPIPPLAEQHRIIAKVDELMGLIDCLENHVVTKNRYQETAAAAAVSCIDEVRITESEFQEGND